MCLEKEDNLHPILWHGAFFFIAIILYYFLLGFRREKPLIERDLFDDLFDTILCLTSAQPCLILITIVAYEYQLFDTYETLRMIWAVGFRIYATTTLFLGIYL